MICVDIPLLTPMVAGFALVCTGQCNARSFDDHIIAAFAQTALEDALPDHGNNSQTPLRKTFSDTNGLIYPPKGIDPGLLTPLFLAPVFWRDAVGVDYLFVLSAYAADQRVCRFGRPNEPLPNKRAGPARQSRGTHRGAWSMD